MICPIVSVVLVGHSIGGIYVRTYAADYPDQVAGLVLLDASHPEQLDRHPEYLTANEAYLQQSAVFPALARLGLFRLYFALGGEIDFAGLPPEQHGQMVALWSSPAYFHSQRAETMAGPQIFAQAQDELGNLGNLPLVVISAGANTPSGWAVLQEELATLSSDSVHQVIPDATHPSLAFNRDHARLVSAGILQIIEAVRAERPLASK
jgi:pimeloyl-ACP methyl ester carboxylesterase